MLVMAAHYSMASYPAPNRAKSSVRHHLQLTFPSQATKEGFLSRLDWAKQRLFPGGGTVDNYRLLTSLLDMLKGKLSEEASQGRKHVKPLQHLSLFWTPQVSLHEKELYILVGIM